MQRIRGRQQQLLVYSVPLHRRPHGRGPIGAEVDVCGQLLPPQRHRGVDNGPVVGEDANVEVRLAHHECDVPVRARASGPTCCFLVLMFVRLCACVPVPMRG